MSKSEHMVPTGSEHEGKAERMANALDQADLKREKLEIKLASTKVELGEKKSQLADLKDKLSEAQYDSAFLLTKDPLARYTDEYLEMKKDENQLAVLIATTKGEIKTLEATLRGCRKLLGSETLNDKFKSLLDGSPFPYISKSQVSAAFLITLSLSTLTLSVKHYSNIGGDDTKAGFFETIPGVLTGEDPRIYQIISIEEKDMLDSLPEQKRVVLEQAIYDLIEMKEGSRTPINDGGFANPIEGRERLIREYISTTYRINGLSEAEAQGIADNIASVTKGGLLKPEGQSAKEFLSGIARVKIEDDRIVSFDTGLYALASSRFYINWANTPLQLGY